MTRARAAELAATWQIDDLTPFTQTATARLWRGRHRGGDAVLKVFFGAGGQEEAAGAHLLAAWGGERAAKVLALAPDAVLMEHLPGPDLADLVRQGRDAEATAILATCAKPRDAGTIPAELHPLTDWLAPLLEAPTGTPEVITRAVSLAQALLSVPTEPVPLHGDLHHENVLTGPRGWAVIDPKGVCGNIGFEVAPAFRNPLGLEDVTHSRARIGALAACFSAALKLPRDEILRWAIVGNAISAVWDIDAGNDPAATLRLLPLLWRSVGVHGLG